MQHAISLRQQRAILVPPGSGALPDAYLAAALKNIETLGFTFSPELIARVRTLTVDEFATLYAELLPALRALVGAHVAFQPFYPNFPAQVMAMDTAILYLNALLHYLTHWRPGTPAEERPPLLDRVDLTVIGLGEHEDFRRVATRLLAARSSLAAADREDLAWFIAAEGEQIATLLPASIPHKETLALLAAGLLRHAPERAPALLVRFVRTATDVLRLAVGLSGGDVSLATPTKFRQFARPERRLLLGLLEDCPQLAEDMRRWREPWKRLGERLHPGEYARRFPRAAAAFDTLRNDRPVVSTASRVEQALRDGDVVAATDLLAARPGELARRLDHLLRLDPDWQGVAATFAKVAAQVSSPVLLQLLTHFTQRTTPHPLRVVFPKGNLARLQALPNTLPPLDPAACAAIVEACRRALLERFAALPSLGRVYVDERLHSYLVPLAQRSASKALRTIARGSRLPIAAGSTIRFFLWWKEGSVGGKPTGRVDIDLSAVLYDADWRYVEHISWTNLRASAYQAAHSGDIVEAPEGACEFIDLDIASVVRAGGRYVVMSLNAYTEQAFCDLPECFAGWMLRQAPGSGEIFEPRTVQDRIDLAADTRICIPAILDLVDRELIWTDLALRRNPRWQNSVEANQRGMVLMGKAMLALHKPTLYELFALHAEARGTPTAERAAADTVFAIDGGVTPFDIPLILAEYL
jgi:hypothetical protein